MRSRLRTILTVLGLIMLVGSIPWQIVLAIWEAASMQVSLESHIARMAFAKAFATNLPQALFDMAVGGGLVMLCGIDERLGQVKS
jgi:hypothetical protein